MKDPGQKKNVLMEVDQILPLIGEFGRFQRCLDVLFALINIPLSFHYLIMYFSTFKPSWRCATNSSVCFFNGTMPSDDDRRCTMPRHEWEFTEPRSYSLATHFDIYCENEWLLNLTHSVFFIGWGLGGIVMGWIGDKFGRKAVFFPSTGVIFTFGLCTAFAPNIYFVIACRFVIGYFITGGPLQMFIIISEIVGRKQRPFAGLFIYFMGTVSLLMLTLQAYFIRDWRLLNIVSNGPYLLILALYKVFPESVRWLQQQGRLEEAMSVIRRIAHWNNKKLPDNIELSPPGPAANHKANPFDLLRTRKIAFSTCIQGFAWMSTNTCFFCFLLAANDLDGSPYRDQVLLQLFSLPVQFISAYSVNRFGRKRTTLIALVVSGAGCLGIAFVPVSSGHLKIFRVVLGILGKFTITMALDCLYTWSFELFPTKLRAEGMGAMMVTAHIGSGSAPWIVKGMRSLGKGAPFVVMAIPPLISASLGMCLPETKMNRLLDNPDESKNSEKNVEL